MITIGIDPGLSGAIAVFDGTQLQRVIDMPTVKVGTKNKIATQALALLIGALKPDHAFVEDVHAMPGQGVTSMFSFGKSAGIIEGMLAAFEAPVSYVSPVAWKRQMQVTKEKGSSRRRAMQLFPKLSADFQRVKDDGRAEAVLIGAYGLSKGAV